MKGLNTFNKYKNILLLFFLGGGVLFSSLFFLKPKVVEIFDLRKEIAQEKNRLANLTQKVAILNGLDELELGRKVEVLFKALPPEKDVANILLTIKVLGAKEGIFFEGIKISPEEDRSTSLEIVGGQKEIINFLGRIETSYPLMRLEEVVLSSYKNENLSKGEIVLQTFSQSLPKTLDSMESPLLPITPEEEKSYEEILMFDQVLVEEDLEPVQTGKENPFL